MAMELICGLCGFRQIYLYYGTRAMEIMRGVLLSHPDAMPCENCGEPDQVTLKEPKDLVALIRKFPLKKVLRTFKTNEQLLALDSDWVRTSYPDEVEAGDHCGKPHHENGWDACKTRDRIASVESDTSAQEPCGSAAPGVAEGREREA